MENFLTMANGGAVEAAAIPQLDWNTFRSAVIAKIHQKKCRILAFFTLPGEETARRLVILLLNPDRHVIEAASCTVKDAYLAFTAECPAFHWFERELFEETGIRPENHPWLKPIRFNSPSGNRPEAGDTSCFTMTGEAVHEVAVGPIHAGVIEPGHFRFQCMGEEVYSLEIELGYQHRQLEKLLSGALTPATIHRIETASGDTSIAASINFCRIVEILGGLTVSPRALSLREIALELERIANHVGDLGALSGDVAFLPTASFCGRIRGDFLNLTAELCGNRFGRHFLTPGGCRFDVDEALIQNLLQRLNAGEKELFHALDLMFDEPSVLDRFENTGCVTAQQAQDLGLVGVAARASGLKVDARQDLPWAENPGWVPAAGREGDVLSRARVRYLELKSSLERVKTLLHHLPTGSSLSEVKTPLCLKPNMLAVSVTEAWRGELCHAVVTDAQGNFARWKIVDPSFHNWFGLAMALRRQQISDFPICNKSFNLSYCGHDL